MVAEQDEVPPDGVVGLRFARPVADRLLQVQGLLRVVECLAGVAAPLPQHRQRLVGVRLTGFAAGLPVELQRPGQVGVRVVGTTQPEVGVCEVAVGVGLGGPVGVWGATLAVVAVVHALSAVLVAAVEVPAVDRFRGWQYFSGWDALADRVLGSTIGGAALSTVVAGVAMVLTIAVWRGQARAPARLVCALCLAVTLCGLPLRFSVFWESRLYSPLAATIYLGGDEIAGLHELYPSWYRFWIWTFLLVQVAVYVLVIALLRPTTPGRGGASS
jgi:hypothetical protein